MPARNLNAVFYVSQPPTLELRDGLFHVCFDIGDEYKFQVVMPPSAFFSALQRSNGLQRDFQAGAAEVISVDFDSKFERIFPKDKTAGH
jgi:hypothetical protein